MENCIFCKIIAGEIPSTRVYEDENMVIIKDLHPQAPIHLLLLPKQHYSNLSEMNEEQALTLGRCLKRLGEIADSLGLQDGYRIASNKGENGCQSVLHLHVHIMGGGRLSESMS